MTKLKLSFGSCHSLCSLIDDVYKGEVDIDISNIVLPVSHQKVIVRNEDGIMRVANSASIPASVSDPSSTIPATQNDGGVDATNDEVESKIKETSEILFGVQKDSLRYKYLRRYANTILAERGKNDNNGFHPLIISNKDVTQKINNNKTVVFKDVQQTGKDAVNEVKTILYVDLFLVDIIDDKQQAAAISEQLMSGGNVNVEADEVADDSSQVVKKARGGWPSYYLLRKNPCDVYDELSNDEEKEQWLKNMKFWDLSLANYIGEFWPATGQEARAAKIGLIPEYLVPTSGKQMSKRELRLQKLKQMR